MHGIDRRISAKDLKVQYSDDGNIRLRKKALFAYCLGPVESRSGRVESAAACGARPHSAHPERGQWPWGPVWSGSCPSHTPGTAYPCNTHIERVQWPWGPVWPGTAYPCNTHIERGQWPWGPVWPGSCPSHTPGTAYPCNTHIERGQWPWDPMWPR